MKKILIVTDISLSKKYNAGNKNALISLCNYLMKNENYNIKVLNFHHKKPSNDLCFPIEHYPDYLNLIKRKFKKIIDRNDKLLEYKDSFFRKLLVSYFLKNNDFDYVIIEYIENHHILDVCKKYGVVTLCDLHDVMSLRRESFKKNSKIPENENLDITLDDEINVINKFDGVITIEDSEREFLITQNVTPDVLLCKRTQQIQNINITKDVVIKERTIGFIGSSAEFNVDALSFFINNIWNMGLYHYGYKLIIAGSICNELRNLYIKGNYKILGKIDTVDEFYSSIHVSINPVFSGSGFKTKNAESLSYGVPVITTLNGIKGLENTNGNYYSLIDCKDKVEDWNGILEIFFRNYEACDFRYLCAKDYIELNNDNSIFKEVNNFLL